MFLNTKSPVQLIKHRIKSFKHEDVNINNKFQGFEFKEFSEFSESQNHIMQKLPSNCFEEILDSMDNDRNTLFSCALVNRHWCRLSIPLLWRRPFEYGYPKDFGLKLLKIYISFLAVEEKELLRAQDIKEYYLSWNNLFNNLSEYTYNIQHLSIHIYKNNRYEYSDIDDSIIKLIQAQKNLEYLSLSNFWGDSSKFYSALEDHNNSLTYLRFEGLSDVILLIKFLNTCRNLITLDLFQSTKVPIPVLITLKNFNPNITHLSLNISNDLLEIFNYLKIMVDHVIINDFTSLREIRFQKDFFNRDHIENFQRWLNDELNYVIDNYSSSGNGNNILKELKVSEIKPYNKNFNSYWYKWEEY
ncbi:13173_t:CDS:2 [Rhizophagus irregularis]|nr:13173_t:CDS:2 [Rhizophagus irregularis]